MTVRPPHPQNLAATLPTVRMIIDVSTRATSPQQVVVTVVVVSLIFSKFSCSESRGDFVPNSDDRKTDCFTLL